MLGGDLNGDARGSRVTHRGRYAVAPLSLRLKAHPRRL